MATSPSHDACGAFRDVLADHALGLLPPERADAVIAHLGGCGACKDEYDCLAAVAAHLSSLRGALAPHMCPQRRSHPSGSGPATTRQRRGRGPAGRAWSASLTLSQWVDRMAYVR
ncbi:zf-HC2 domain-containing protein [Streptomyces olivochromogenes]|uniref:zf-HC2 domain-containing protein n=1 Tax=Streptomyces olivochromogenes TaxID=1963 RepID=UPI001F2B6853|nr:zf-HC2 domain-containing protein [Streptomyces olivochromogenes]MCF3129663.1 zf-HC2 domain-containing protein [Streptomyces olivochromogenes]